MDNSELIKLLERELKDRIRIRTDLSGADVTTFALGGKLKLLIEPSSVATLSDLLSLLKSKAIRPLVLGAGSNLLVPEAGVEKPIIRLSREYTAIGECDGSEPLDVLLRGASDLDTNAPEGDEVKIFAGSGVSFMALSRRTGDAGLAGLEFAAGIPASVGGAVFMNAGAHGSSIADVLDSVFLVDMSGAVTRKSIFELRPSYRSLGLKGNIVLGAVFRMLQSERGAVRARRAECLDYRRRTQPLQFPSAGSTFKNPAGFQAPVAVENPIEGAGTQNFETAALVDGVSPRVEVEGKPAGWLLDRLGFKGKQRGGARFSELHANWIIKDGEKASADDVKSLIASAREAVMHEWKIDLEPELVMW